MRKVEIEFIKDQIKQTLTLKDIVEFYVGQPNNYTHRYKCPFNHDESKCNFEVKDRYWRCFSCGASGDEIELVRKLFDIQDYQDCLLKIAQDFGLKVAKEFDPEYEKRIREIKAKREKEKYEQELFDKNCREIYNRLIKRQNQLEEIIKRNQPYNPKKLENYMKTDCPDILMHAVKQYNINEAVVNIFLGYDISDYDSAIYGYAVWADEKAELKKRVVNDIVAGKIKMDKKGDILSAYGYEF